MFEPAGGGPHGIAAGSDPASTANRPAADPRPRPTVMERHRSSPRPSGSSTDPGAGRDPSEFPRRVLLAVTGLSPQIVTETIYALAVRREPPFLPTEIHLVTTREGAERARLTLLSDHPGWLWRLLAEYDLPAIDFGEERIHVLRRGDGSPVDDIRTEAENQIAADTITRLVRALTTDANTALHVSIAGGRKTMGFFAGYALSLFARPQDRLSHVLVSPSFEGNQGFFYPSRASRVLFTPPPHSRPIDARDAEVTLAEIPFVRLRSGLDPRLLAGTTSFVEAVESAQRALAPAHLILDLPARRVSAGGTVFPLPPVEMAFLSWLARRSVAGRPVESPPEGVPDRDLAAEFLEEARLLDAGPSPRTRRRLRDGMEKSFFEETRARLQRRLREALGPQGAARYGVQRQGGRPYRYALALAPDQISWAPIPPSGREP